MFSLHFSRALFADFIEHVVLRILSSTFMAFLISKCTFHLVVARFLSICDLKLIYYFGHPPAAFFLISQEDIWTIKFKQYNELLLDIAGHYLITSNDP